MTTATNRPNVAGNIGRVGSVIAPGSRSLLRIRCDKHTDIHEAFLSLGCALICWQSLRKTWKTA